MRRAAVLAAVLLAGLAGGCGGGSSAAAPRAPVHLCVDVGLAPNGQAAAASRDLLGGLRSQIPAAGVRLGRSELGLCRILDDGTSLGAALAHARAAARDPATVAYLGELSGARAAAVETVLAPAGLPLISPSGRAITTQADTIAAIVGDAPTGADAAGADAANADATAAGTGAGTRTGPENPFPTLFSLAPSERLQSRARTELASARRCGPHRHQRTLCAVLGPDTAPLCTLAPERISPTAPEVLCVLAGPDLLGRGSPAFAYGQALGEILLAAARGASASGGVLSRTALLAHLARLDLRTSAIGRVRFDAAGVNPVDLFSVYTVRSDGHLLLSQTFRTH